MSQKSIVNIGGLYNPYPPENQPVNKTKFLWPTAPSVSAPSHDFSAFSLDTMSICHVYVSCPFIMSYTSSPPSSPPPPCSHVVSTFSVYISIIHIVSYLHCISIPIPTSIPLPIPSTSPHLYPLSLLSSLSILVSSCVIVSYHLLQTKYDIIWIIYM